MNHDLAQIETIADIVYRHEPRPWPFASEKASAIESHWDRLVAGNARFFNGRVLMMHRCELTRQQNGTVLHGGCFETEYKAFIAWRDFGFPDPHVRNCFAMPALRSSDGAFILGEMAQLTASPGRIYFPAGTPEPGDIVDDLVDLDGNIVRELEEETGIGPDEVELLPGWTAVFVGPRLACMKIVQSQMTAATIVDKVAAFLQQETEPELTRVLPVFSLADLDAARMPDFTLAYLRHAFDRGAKK